MSGRHAATPRRRHASLDLLMGCGVVCCLVALCFQCVPALSVKARLVSVFLAVPPNRLDGLERLAVTGALAADAPVAPPESQDGVQVVFDLTSAGQTLVARGTVGRDAQPFALSFTPALSDGGEATVRWVCGAQRPARGWHAASAPALLSLPHGAHYAICRDDGEEGA